MGATTTMEATMATKVESGTINFHINITMVKDKAIIGVLLELTPTRTPMEMEQDPPMAELM